MKIFAGCARREISKYFLPNSCIPSTAITIDVMTHYQRQARPWEVCVRVTNQPYHLDLGCFDPESQDEVGGHLVAIVEDAFLVDASLGQVHNANRAFKHIPPVMVGELLPPNAPLRDMYQFSTRGGVLQYESRQMFRDYRQSLDWGPSPERDATRDSIIKQIDGYRAHHGIS